MLNVKDFGAVGTGQVDDTAAFNAALALAASQNGGTILIPPGNYALNLTLTQGNIILQGDGGVLIPFNPALPVVRVGDDIQTTRFVSLKNLTIKAIGPNGYGLIGLDVTGGASKCNYEALVITNFYQHCLRVQSGPNLPTFYHYFNNLTLQSDPNNCQSTLKLDYGPVWATAIFISNLTVEGSNTGYAIENNGCDIVLANAWVQVKNNHGVKFTKPGTTSPVLRCNGVYVDSDNSSDVLVEKYDSNQTITTVMQGLFMVDGLVRIGDGTLTPTRPGNASLPYQTQLNYGQVTGKLSFTGSSTTYNEANAISGDLAAGALNVGAANSIRFNPGGAKRLEVRAGVGPILPSYVLANRPNPVGNDGALIYVWDAPTGSKLQYSDGAIWNSAG